jgi:hypothetical protein
MKIEAITVCINYADILRVAVPENQHLLDDWIIVTSPDDDETREVCRRHNLRCVLSEEHRRGGPFNKGRLIQRGFDQINGSDWVLHVDGDVVLPRRFRELLDWAHLDHRCIYGADRCNVVGYEAWQKLKSEKGCWDNHGYQNNLTIRQNVGSRWVSKLHGYVPIGFFQLTSGSEIKDRGIHLKTYPYSHGDCARADIQFALQWDRRYRQLLPEVVVLHLESEAAPLGKNWKGRKTKRFGPPQPTRPDMKPAPQGPEATHKAMAFAIGDTATAGLDDDWLHFQPCS